MKLIQILAFVSMVSLSLAVSGCGNDENNTSVGSTSTSAASAPCIGCHEGAVSSVSLTSVTAEWEESRHNTSHPDKKAVGYGASCGDCHEPSAGHPNSCSLCHGGKPVGTASRHDVVINPDSSLKCSKCHTAATMGAPHFNNVTSPANATATRTGYPASFVTSRGVGSCRNCHNPHNPSKLIEINREWAESAHGQHLGEAWKHYDFKTRGTFGANPAVSSSSDCVRCHSTTGLINYITSGFTDVSPWGNAADKTKEVLQCNGCHDRSYNYTSQRQPGRITAYYNYSSKNTKKVLVNFTFPDVGKSNICLCCHSARESGLTLARIAGLPSSGSSFVNYSTQNFINSHYLTAGATIFGISGNEFPGLDYADPAYYYHKYLGGTSGNRPGVGPCVTCHMQMLTVIERTTKPSHKFKPTLTNGNGANCIGCHLAPPVSPLPVVVSSTAILEQQKNGYHSALTILASALKKRGYKFQSNSPYFTNTNWQTPHTGGSTGGYGPGTGASTLGAAFNFNLLVHDPGGFAHNSQYAKRLIYDSIVWITTGSLPVPGQDITPIIFDTTLIPNDPALVATTDGVPIDFTGTTAAAMRSAALAWLTNGSPTGQRP